MIAADRCRTERYGRSSISDLRTVHRPKAASISGRCQGITVRKVRDTMDVDLGVVRVILLMQQRGGSFLLTQLTANLRFMNRSVTASSNSHRNIVMDLSVSPHTRHSLWLETTNRTQRCGWRSRSPPLMQRR